MNIITDPQNLIINREEFFYKKKIKNPPPPPQHFHLQTKRYQSILYQTKKQNRKK